MALTGENLRRLIDLAGGTVADRQEGSAPPASPPGPTRLMTVAIASAGDPEQTFLTLAGLLLGDSGAHFGPAGPVGVLIVDTAPHGGPAWALKELEWSMPGLRYLPAADVPSRVALMDRAIREAHAEWVLYVEAPALLAPGAIDRLLDFVTAHPSSTDLLQGPRLRRDVGLTTHFEPLWQAGTFGVPGQDPRGLDPDAVPFEIPMQDLAVLACRTAAWVGGSPHLRGPAGAEGYVHEKVRHAGGRTLCLPFLRWARAEDPAASPSDWAERIRNYLIGWEEVGLPLEPLHEHFDERIDEDAVRIARARWETEKANPLSAFDGIFCINLDSRPDRWARMHKRFQRLGIAERVRRVPGVETPLDNHVGCALAHRSVLELARREGLEQVLVFEDDTIFLEGALWVLRRSIAELQGKSWKILYLGSFASTPFARAEGCLHLEAVHGLIGLHAIAFQHSVYDELLAALPADAAAMSPWAAQHPIDVYIAQTFTEDVYRVAPMVATQECLVPEMAPDLRDQFALD